MTQATEAVSIGKYTVISKVWKAFQALLQYCCQTEYQQISEKLIKEKNEAIQQVIDEYTQKQEEYMRKTQVTIERLQEKEKQFNVLENEKEAAVRARIKAER